MIISKKDWECNLFKGKGFLKTLAGASLLITLFNAGGKGLGFLRELIFSSSFGLDAQLDIYFVSSLIPLIISTTVYYIAQNYYIPGFSQKNEQGEANSGRYLQQAISKGLVISLIVFIGLYFLSDSIVLFFLRNASSDEILLSRNILIIYSSTIPFYTFISIVIAWGYFKYNYLHSLISQIWTNLFIILSVLLYSDQIGVYAIAVGYFVGIIFQFIHLLIINFKDIFRSYSHSMPDGMGRKFAFGFIIILLIEFVGQLNPFIDRSFYSQLPEGSISALNYAMNLMLLPVNIVAIAFSTALFPHVSDYYATRNIPALLSKLGLSVDLILFLFMPVVILIIFFPEHVIRIVYFNSSFSPADVKIISECFFAFGLSLIFYAIYAVFSKFLYGIDNAMALLAINIIGIAVKFLLNFFFVPYFSYLTLAASTSVSFIIMFGLSIIVLYRRLGSFYNFGINDGPKILLSGLLVLISGIAVSANLKFEGFTTIALFSLSLGVLYLCFCWIFKVKIVGTILKNSFMVG